MDAGSAFVTGLALGLSSGGHCFWTCAAVMGPYLVSTDGRGAGAAATRWSTVPAALRTLGWYNLGRLIAYLTVGLVVSWLAARGAALPVALQAGARIAVAAVLAVSLVRPAPEQRCWGARRGLGAFTVGVLQGLSPCPPFLAAVGLGLSASGPAAGLLLFVALFVSTALFTLPLALLEPLRRRVWLTHVTRVVGAVVCAYLVVSAVIMLR